MSLPDFDSLAGKIVNDCLRVKAGEYFRIVCGDNLYYDFCEKMCIQAIEVGAYPFINISSDLIHEKTLEKPLEYFKAPALFTESIARFVNVELQLVFPKDPETGSSASPEKLSAIAQRGKAVRDIIHERNRKRVEIRQASLVYPTMETARKYGIPFEEYSDMVWGAINIDYDQLRERAQKIAGIMRGSKKVHITNPQGTDLTFSIEGRPPFIDDGIFDEDDINNGVYMMNLPTGEVCIAPVEDSANGTAVFTYNRYQGHELKNLVLEFRDGRIVDIKGDQGADFYRSVLDKQTGDKDYIAELGIGLNPRINRVLGDLALDEKIIGTIHIATGENRMIHGKGKSSFHWDLVMEKPTLTIDGKGVMKEGNYLV